MNSAILNVALIHTGQLQMNITPWDKPIQFIKNYCKLFSQQLSQNRISLRIEDEIKGDPQACFLLCTQGILID